MQHLKVSAAVASLAVLVSCSSSPPSHTPTRNRPAAAAERGILAECLPHEVADRQAPLLGASNPQQRLKLAFQLPLRNQAELTQLLRDLYDPGSPSYHKYLSVSEFTERFGPTAADYRKVVAW